VKVGFALPVSGSWATPDTIAHVARRAEELGYQSLWTFQRLLSPVDGAWGENYRSVTDPLVTLGYVSAVTSRVRLGVAVINMPFVSPVLLAKQATTLDILSGGRLDLGLGLGWSEEEYIASSTTKKGQARRGEEFVSVLKALWTEDPVEHTGEFYRLPRTEFAPRPVQRPHPPILLGGMAEPALQRAGRIADGWVSSSRADLATIGDSIRLVKQAAEAAGRDPRRLRFVCRGVVKVRETGQRAPLTGTLEQIRSDLAVVAEAGVTELFVDLNFDPEIGSPSADPRISLGRAETVLEALAPA
jgi:probable F420-dependent oxidoreductase